MTMNCLPYIVNTLIDDDLSSFDSKLVQVVEILMQEKEWPVYVAKSRWPGDPMSHAISSSGIALAFLEHSVLSTRMIKNYVFNLWDELPGNLISFTSTMKR